MKKSIPTTSSPSSTTEKNPEGRKTEKKIIGGVVTAVLCVGIIILVAYFLCRRMKGIAGFRHKRMNGRPSVRNPLYVELQPDGVITPDNLDDVPDEEEPSNGEAQGMLSTDISEVEDDDKTNFHNPLYDGLFTRGANGHRTNEKAQLLDHDELAVPENEEEASLVDIIEDNPPTGQLVLLDDQSL